jgi:hypothetical protein
MSEILLIPCTCGNITWLPEASLVEITQRRPQPAAETDFVNWVCERCGRGSLHFADKLKKQAADPLMDSLMRRRQRPIYRTFLQCKTTVPCDSSVRVHALAQGADQNANPTKPLSDWKVGALECCNGHHPSIPLVAKWAEILGREE